MVRVKRQSWSHSSGDRWDVGKSICYGRKIHGADTRVTTAQCGATQINLWIEGTRRTLGRRYSFKRRSRMLVSSTATANSSRRTAPDDPQSLCKKACTYCGKKGHLAVRCYQRKRAKYRGSSQHSRGKWSYYENDGHCYFKKWGEELTGSSYYYCWGYRINSNFNGGVKLPKFPVESRTERTELTRNQGSGTPEATGMDVQDTKEDLLYKNTVGNCPEVAAICIVGITTSCVVDSGSQVTTVLEFYFNTQLQKQVNTLQSAPWVNLRAANGEENSLCMTHHRSHLIARKGPPWCPHPI